MPQVHVNGVELYYEVHGEGPALVLCHGASGNHLNWWQQVPFFMDRYRCIIFDHRGWGLSLVQPGQPGAAAFVDDLEGLLDHLEINDVRLLGFSMGGRTALGYTLRYPERVKALVLADTTAAFATEGMAKRLQEIQQQRAATPDPIAALVAPDYPQREPAMMFLAREIFALNPPRDPDFMTRGQPPPPPTLDQLQNLRVPVLFIVGEHDASTPPDVVREMQACIPGSRLEIIAGAAHSTYFEKPAVFNRLVADFLATCDG